MSKYFNGFDGFDCRKEIWNGVFRANAHGGTKRLREILSDPKDLPEDSAVFTRKLKGENAWTCEPNKFFSYSEDPQAYRQFWLEQLTNPPGCLEVFRRFMASVPENASNSDYARFLPSARKVCSYLEQILLHCGSYPADSKEWIAAGMYVLTAFFLQNSKSATPHFYCPPREHDPVSAKESTVVVPDVVMNPPEDEEIQFDFFLTMRKRYEEMFGKEKDGNSGDNSGEKISEKVCLAISRLELRPFSSDFTILDPEGMTTYAYLITEYLSFEEGNWCLREMLRQIPHESEARDGYREAQKFLVNTDLLMEDECHIVLLTVAHDGSKGLLNTAVFTEGDKMYVSRESTKVCMKEPSLYVSRQPTIIDIVEIDENGHYRDGELETLFDFCGVSLTLDTPAQPVKWKKATSDFNPAYLQYLILDVQGRKEIPKTISRDPVTGAYKIHATLPCPGKLIAMEVKPEGADAESYALAGYLHGAYGLKKNPEKAKEIAKRGAESGNLQMAFEYGAILKQNGVAISAEYQLRRAADANIPGAQFELAELLYNKATHTKPSEEKESNQYLWDKNYQDWALTEAKKLIDDLWSRGYRTYGQASIDLFGEHT